MVHSRSVEIGSTDNNGVSATLQSGCFNEEDVLFELPSYYSIR